MRLLLCVLAMLTIPVANALAVQQPNYPPSLSPPREFVPYSPTSAAACSCIDLALIIDDTGSMGGAIDNVKAGIVDLLALADSISCNNLQSGLVTFADVVEVDKILDFNTAGTVTAVNALVAGGGGNLPEASDEALREVLQGSNLCNIAGFNSGAFRAGCCKIAVLVTDALPGGCDDTYTSGTDDVNADNRAVQAGGLDIAIAALQVGNYDAQIPPIMVNYAVKSGGVYGQTPADGSGTSAAIEQAIRNCAGSSPEQVYCCTGDGCFQVADEASCRAIGGVLTPSCDSPSPDCPTPAKKSSWGSVKVRYGN